MISTRKLIYGLDQRLNKLASNEHQEIQEEDKLLILNETQKKLIKQKIGPNNIYRLGLDAFKKRYADLQNLIESYQSHQIKLTKKDQNLHRYTCNISGLEPEFMFYIDSYVKGNKKSCKDQILYLDRSLLRHDSVSTLLDSTIYKPSFEWRRVLADMSNSELGYYTDGTFEIDTVFLSYLRYPKEMDIAGYVKLDGSDSKDQDCELENYLEDELLDLAELSLGMSTNNNSSVQNAQLRISTNE